MRQCEQAPGFNMLQHGESVAHQYRQLIEQLESGQCVSKITSLYDKLKSKLPPPEVLRPYHVYHDCGKHLCLEIDEQGRRHFPNHAKLSAKQYELIFPEDKFTVVLIRKDMDFHTMKGEELEQLCKSPFAPILYFTAWAEINANAEMFGGRDSTSYKIKAKKLLKATKLLNH